MHLTNNNPTALRRHKGHRRDHFLSVPCAEKITRLWRKTAAPQAGKFWDRAAMRSTAEKKAHARASVRPHASSGETDSVRAADGLHAARPRSVRCWRYCDPAQNTASRRPFCLRKSSSHRRLVTSNRGQSHRAADGEAALIDGLCIEGSSRSAGECVDLVLHFNANTTIWISPCRWKKLADGLGGKLGFSPLQNRRLAPDRPILEM